MRLILYNANETAFETYGLGEIDATKAQVTRERNGNYTLYIEYPASGPLAGTFKNDMRIKSDAGLRTKNQTFFISRILKDSTGILKVYAKHISHLTETMAIRNNTVVSGTAQSALAIWASNTLGGIRFDVWSDIELSSKTSWDIANFKTARDALGGVSGSILDVWGGEYEFDNTTIRLHKQLGRKSPIVLEYGRNILRAEDDQDIESAYTSVYPYATYTPENQGTGDTTGSTQQVTVELPEKYVDGPYIGLYNERRVLIMDFSSNFKEKEVPTVDKLRKLAKDYAINNRLGLPKINTKIEYVDLSKTLDYKLTQILEEAELCDIVPVYYPQIGLTSEDAKLTTIVYDVLLEQNDSVEVGVIGDGFKSSMTSNLSGKIDDLANNQQRLVNTLPDYLLNAQGNKVWYNRPDNKEHKIGDIWFEKNGLYDRMYVWNGSQWEKRIDTEDVDNVKKEVNRQLEETQLNIVQAITEANEKAQEALEKAGTLPDTSRLSDQIKQQILNSPELQNKVTEGVKSVDGDTIYSKIVSKVSQQFATRGEFESIDRVQNDMGRDLIGLSKQIATQTLEFNKLTESNKIYERILGKSETEAPDKLSRLVMSSEIFQTEVGSYSTQGGPNMLRNSRADEGLKYWTEENGRLNFTSHQFYFNGQKRMFEISHGAIVKSPRFIVKRGADYMLNMLGFDANSKSFKVYFCKRSKGATIEFQQKQLLFNSTGSPIFSSSQAVKKSFKFNVGDFDEGFLQFEYEKQDLTKWGGLFLTELDFYEGSNDRKWQPSPDDPSEALGELGTRIDSKVNEVSGLTAEAKQLAVGAQARADQATDRSSYAREAAEDAKMVAGNAQQKAIQVAEQARQAKETAEATRTQVTQLAGSWSVRNLNSAGDVIGQINLNKDGSVRINEGLISIGDKTYIKDGVIKSGMIANAQIGTAHIDEIDANTARLINVSAKNIATDGLTANIIKGGRLSSLNGITDFDLQTGWIDMNNANVGIRNQFRNKPLQYLVFGEGKINEKDASYTALMSNSWKRVAMDDGSAGIQIWNANDNTTAVNIYGDLVEFMYNANDNRSIAINTVNNNISGVDDISLRGHSLVGWFGYIDQNFRKINDWLSKSNLGHPGLYPVNM